MFSISSHLLGNTGQPGDPIDRKWGTPSAEERRIFQDSVEPFCRLQKRKATLKEDADTPPDWSVVMGSQRLWFFCFRCVVANTILTCTERL